MNEDTKIKELEEQVKELNAQIKELKGADTLAELCKNRPLYLPAVRDVNEAEVFLTDFGASGVWLYFKKLAMEIHARPGVYKQREKRAIGPNISDAEKKISIPKKISDLSEDEKQLSARMMDELIAIYNKYFIEAQMGNVHVLYKNDGTVVEVPILPPKEG